ncbi:aafdbbf5-0fd0-4f8c-8841-a3417d129ed1 [Sclerotinia trifoliorum]|uniref:Aafdbbf5-0fd0-4f8c-8841-a3417d129ed1 n=1 Tax=Sclerotinia trifoliorum TaxID=28548 RepID=A0A8H2ZNE6_9HELO|nr:aafdbbf5-0fd0-4f8c-8841-a3417d129ed1 [Sclerotinia trifoliorum]
MRIGDGLVAFIPGSPPNTTLTFECPSPSSIPSSGRTSNPQSQQPAAFSNQINQAGHFARNNNSTLFSQLSGISLLKRFVKHLTTWDKGTIIAVVAIVVSTIISYFALKLAIWTATKDYIEYCQVEEEAAPTTPPA